MISYTHLSPSIVVVALDFVSIFVNPIELPVRKVWLGYTSGRGQSDQCQNAI